MKYLAGWREVSIRGCFDLVGRCCRVTFLARSRFNCRVTSAWPIHMFPTSNTGSRKYYLWEKIIGWKVDLFLITESFLWILDRLCAEPMRRSHDFLSLTLAVVGLTFDSSYFLLQSRCLSVCVLCVLVVWCVKSKGGWIRINYFNLEICFGEGQNICWL